MLTDLVKIRALSAAQAQQNIDFQRFLHHHHAREEPLQRIAAAVTAQIDCSLCANCCRETRVEVTPQERERLERIRHGCTVHDPQAGYDVLRQLHDECIFLECNRCTIYDERPSACRGYPHLLTAYLTLGHRLSSITRNAAICPIVFNTLEIYKRQVGFPRVHHAAQCSKLDAHT